MNAICPTDWHTWIQEPSEFSGLIDDLLFSLLFSLAGKEFPDLSRFLVHCGTTVRNYLGKWIEFGHLRNPLDESEAGKAEIQENCPVNPGFAWSLTFTTFHGLSRPAQRHGFQYDIEETNFPQNFRLPWILRPHTFPNVKEELQIFQISSSQGVTILS